MKATITLQNTNKQAQDFAAKKNYSRATLGRYYNSKH